MHTDASVRYPCCLLRTIFGTLPACYLQSSYTVQHAVRYPRAFVRFPCCLLRTAFGTHPACYLHRFCTHRNRPFGTQGPRSAPKGSKLRDPYRKSRFPLWPVNNLTAIVGGTGPGWKLIQDHQHSIVWGAHPPTWSPLAEYHAASHTGTPILAVFLAASHAGTPPGHRS